MENDIFDANETPPETNKTSTNDAPVRLSMAELREMPKSELSRYLKKIQKAYDSFPHRKSAEVYPEIKKLLDANGLTFEEFADYMKKEGKLATDVKKVKAKRKAKAPKKPAPAKYHSPEDASKTWTGKGRRPTWFVEHVENGGDPEALKIA